MNEEFRAEENAYSNIGHVIGVISGKGGVGKSMVTASLANAMALQGFRVGVLDADITGPSIPKMYGLSGTVDADENGMYPAETANGIAVMSVNLLLPGEEEPVIWRGPVIGNMVKQFWTDVIWGQMDYLFVDMPPGTGDVPLTVFQSLPVDGVVLVTSPQDLVRMIVAKALNMSRMMEIPVLGMIENYSYMSCPHCGEKLYPFGESHLDEISSSYNVPILGRIPVDPELAKAADAGEFAGVSSTVLDDAVIRLREL
ncbi:MAG: Mrp/NBP35 family ATP-binding protein [Eubacterium sp.]|nr:Mrp/NBP35 family ATP-binding protein [Eubacterium sp.]